MALADLLRAIVRHRKPRGVYVTVVTPVDRQEMARAVQRELLRSQRRNLSNGVTRIRP